MLEINLLPVREARRAADIRQYGTHLALIILLTVGGVGLYHSRLNDQIERTDARVRQMRNDIDQFKPQLDKVAAFKLRKGELEKKIDVIDGLDRARSGPVRMMSELSLRVPSRLWIKSMATRDGVITLKGESLDNEIVATFLKNLADSPYFGEVDLDGTKLGKSKAGFKTVGFSLKAKLIDPNAPEEPEEDPTIKKKKGKKRSRA
jgi:type IV pilus assembly protein PilN